MRTSSWVMTSIGLALALACAGIDDTADTADTADAADTAPALVGPAQVGFSGYDLISDDNGDDTLNPGEYVTVKVYVQNTGGDVAEDVYASLSTTDAYTTIHTGNPVYVDSVLDPGEEQDANWSFEITTAAPAEHSVEFELLIVDAQRTWTDSFSVPVKATGARVDFSRYELISDDNDDETLNPGEYATMKVYVQNTGSSGALTVYASLSTTDAYATIHTGNPVYVDSVLDPGEEQDANWSFEITSSTPDDHVIEFELLLLDEHDNLWTDSFSVPVRPTGADVIYSRHEIISDSDDDRVPEAGESVTMKVYLENTGSSSALTVNTSLSTTDAYTTIHTGNPVYVDSVLDPGEEQDANWSLELGEFMPSGHEIVFFLTSTDEHGNTWSDDFVLTEGVGAVGLVYYDHEVTEVSGDGDPRVEPGETWALDLALRNLGDSASDVASARLSTTDAHVVIGDDNSSAFGAIGPGDIEWSGDDYQFTVLASHPGGAIPFAIAISAGTLSFSGDFDVEVAP